jgi:hypothetical protein
MKLVFGVLALVVTIEVLTITAGHGPLVALGQGGMPMNGMVMQGMGKMGGPFSPSSRPISMDKAVQVLREWPAVHHIDGIVLDEVEAYTQNFYGQFKERGTGKGAIQVLVDRYSGRTMPEMGPNIMWNTKYRHAMVEEMRSTMGMEMSGTMGNMQMPGMMGSGANPQSSGTQISNEQARQDANNFLSGYLPGATVGDGDAFYGYFHFDVLRGGHQVGMLSVNAANGQVWYHTWHGEFLEKREVGH